MFIPIAPLPSLKRLLFLQFENNVPWKCNERDVVYFPRGGVALSSAAKYVRGKTKQKRTVIYVPDYFCNQSLSWIREEEFDIEFYPVGLDFKPDWEELESLVKTGKPPDLFILVHYFGFANDVVQASNFCRQYDAMLLEDAAHVLIPTENIGNHGDFTLFSPHKLLPLPPIGLLTLDSQIKKSDLELPTESIGRRGDLIWMAKRLIQLCLDKSGVYRRNIEPVDQNNEVGHEGYGNTQVDSVDKLSKIVKAWLNSLIGDLSRIGIIRQNNYDKLELVLSKFSDDLKVKAAFACRDKSDIPYLFTLRTEEPVINKLFEQLLSHNIPAQTWPDIPPEVQANRKVHSRALELHRNVLTLPIHQSLGEKHINYMCNILNKTLESIKN